MRRLASLVVALVVALLVVPTAFAEESQVVTTALKLQIPFAGKTVMGSLVIQDSGSPSDMVAPWSFVGQVDGKAASASGKARGHWTGSGYEGEIIEFTTWDMGGLPRPVAPVPMVLQSRSGPLVSSGTTVRGVGAVSVPIVLQGIDRLPPPFQGNLTVSVTNASLGQQVQQLPRTGVAPAWVDWAAIAALLAGLGGLIFSRSLGRKAA